MLPSLSVTHDYMLASEVIKNNLCLFLKEIDDDEKTVLANEKIEFNNKMNKEKPVPNWAKIALILGTVSGFIFTFAITSSDFCKKISIIDEKSREHIFITSLLVNVISCVILFAVRQSDTELQKVNEARRLRLQSKIRVISEKLAQNPPLPPQEKKQLLDAKDYFILKSDQLQRSLGLTSTSAAIAPPPPPS